MVPITPQVQFVGVVVQFAIPVHIRFRVRRVAETGWRDGVSVALVKPQERNQIINHVSPQQERTSSVSISHARIPVGEELNGVHAQELAQDLLAPVADIAQDSDSILVRFTGQQVDAEIGQQVVVGLVHDISPASCWWT